MKITAKTKVLALTLSCLLLNACQLNNQESSLKDQQVTLEQQAAQQKQLLTGAYLKLVPMLNNYYPINTTTYGLIYSQGDSTYEALADTLIKQGSALCLVKDNCPSDTVYLSTSRLDLNQDLLISLHTDKLSLTQLYCSDGKMQSDVSVNTTLSPLPISNITNLGSKNQSHELKSKKQSKSTLKQGSTKSTTTSHQLTSNTSYHLIPIRRTVSHKSNLNQLDPQISVWPYVVKHQTYDLQDLNNHKGSECLA